MPEVDIHEVISNQIDELLFLHHPHPTHLVVGSDIWQALAADGYLGNPSAVSVTSRAFKYYRGMTIIIVPTPGYCQVGSRRVGDMEAVIHLRSDTELHAT